MAQTPSNMLPLGTRAPDFTLPDTVSSRNLSLDQLKGAKGRSEEHTSELQSRG